MLLGAFLPADTFLLRGLWFVIGVVICSAGVSLLFHTYIAPEAYELVVKEIAAKPESVFDVTAKSNLVAVVSDGTAILGLGDLGAAASIPVMEGKAVLFKAFGDVDAWPVPLNHCRMDGKNEGKTDPKRVIEMVKALAPQYGGVNLEDIASPACFEIEDELDAALDGVIEDAVNSVGVDLNTASAPLLSRVSGINSTVAKNIVDYRDENGVHYVPKRSVEEIII